MAEQLFVVSLPKETWELVVDAIAQYRADYGHRLTGTDQDRITQAVKAIRRAR